MIRALLTLPIFAAALSTSAPADEPEKTVPGGFPDPAPPKVNELPKVDPPAAAENKSVTFHGAPKPLSEEAVTEPWNRFLGPRDDASSRESPLTKKFPGGALIPVWEMAKGEGYTSPAIADGRLIFFHRIEGKETVECLEPETGKRFWKFEYPVEYRDRYGYANGPRASPVIDGDLVYTYGVTAQLHCLEIATGRVLWKRDLQKDFKIRSAFFGNGPTPLINGDNLIINVGGESGPCVAAFRKKTGALVWGAEKEWGASYASPIAAEIRGEERILVFAGGESDPAHGGLLTLDPKDGKILDRFFWRADMYTSVNAATPVVLPGDRAFITECYKTGGVMLEFDGKMKSSVAYKTPEAAAHWTTPVSKDGHLYVVDGRHQQTSEIVCFEIESGEEKWREAIDWEIDVGSTRPFKVGFQRGSLLKIDGAFLALGELGSLLWLDLTPEGAVVLSRTQPFVAPQTWTLPAVHRGLVYISQHEQDPFSKTEPRLLCYDLRKP